MQDNVLLVPSIIPKEFCQYLTHALMRNVDVGTEHTDSQVPDSKTLLTHELLFETLQERLWPRIENAVGEELIPTYSYARLYVNGNKLEPHTDRPACEVSVTLQLGRSHHYSYPIYMGGKRIDLAEGDAVIYPGMDIEHWREECNGPEEYYSGQVFMHFVKKHGNHTDEAGDKKNRDNYSYARNRTALMESK